MRIHTDTTYNNLRIYSRSKALNGFYLKHLEAVHSILDWSRLNIPNPRAAHLVIDSPRKTALVRLNKELKRWLIKEGNPHNCKPTYFACIETKPRANSQHMHVMLVFPALKECTLSLKLLARRLEKLSDTGESRVYKRKISSNEDSCDVDIQSIAIEENSSTSTVSTPVSPYFHHLDKDFEDAFCRFSYLSKVFSKPSEQIRGVTFSHSRIPRRVVTKSSQAMNAVDTTYSPYSSTMYIETLTSCDDPFLGS